MKIVHLPSTPAVLLRQDFLRDELVQTVHILVDVDPVPDLLLQERLHPVDDGVDDGQRVHDVHFLELDRVGFLDAHQEFLNDGGGDLGEVVDGGRAGVEDVHVAGHPHLLGGEPNIADHEGEFHDVGDVGGVEVFDGGAHDGDALAVGGETGERGALSAGRRG